jgi:hypothetical protein
MGYFHRFIIFGLLAGLLMIEIWKIFQANFLLFLAFIPPRTPSGEQTQHIVKGQIFVFELLFQ